MNLIKNLRNGLAAMLALSLCALPASAADVFSYKAIQATIIGEATVDATAAYTNSTTSYTDITGASVTVPATNKAWSGKQFIKVCYYADVTKATSTTGIIGIYVNGAIVAASERAISSAAARGTISACYTVARADKIAYTVKLQGKSGDTAQFTVSQLQMNVQVLFQN